MDFHTIAFCSLSGHFVRYMVAYYVRLVLYLEGIVLTQKE